MLAIVNVSPEDAPMRGLNQYELRINQRVICTFEHDRGVGNLSQCLRDAADAFDKRQKDIEDKHLNPEFLIDMFNRMQGSGVL